MNQAVPRFQFVLSFLAFLRRRRAIRLEPDTDLEHYLFCRDLRASGPPRR